jgi:hypothetical protein
MAGYLRITKIAITSAATEATAPARAPFTHAATGMIHPAKHQNRQSVFQNAVQNGPQPNSLNGDVSMSLMCQHP